MGDACHIPMNGPTEPDSPHFSSNGPLSAAIINVVFMPNNEENIPCEEYYLLGYNTM
jgi:hypothetical protein